jgi:hypothetical protein
MLHVFAHSFANQLFNKRPYASRCRREHSSECRVYYEEPGKSRFPKHAIHTFENPVSVKTGDLIGYVGDAGFSTGSHIHYEIHNSRFEWTKWHERVDPKDLYRETWNRHKGDIDYEWHSYASQW